MCLFSLSSSVQQLVLFCIPSTASLQSLFYLCTTKTELKQRQLYQGWFQMCLCCSSANQFPKIKLVAASETIDSMVSTRPRSMQKKLPNRTYACRQDFINFGNQGRTSERRAFLQFLNTSDDLSYICILADPDQHYFLRQWPSALECCAYQSRNTQQNHTGANRRTVTM